MALLNRTIVRAEPRPRTGVQYRPIVLTVVVAIVIISVVQIVQTSRATTANYDIQRLEQERLQLESSVRQMEADVASLSSLERVRREANGLGLAPPQKRYGVEVGLPWPADEGEIPSRFQAGEGQRDADEGGSPWWRDALELLPFD
jgi:cell division protein FtsL